MTSGANRPPKQCHYCGLVGPYTRDHVVPRSRGGCGEEWNLVVACARCNVSKSDDWPTCPCPICTEAVELHRLLYGVSEHAAPPKPDLDAFIALRRELGPRIDTAARRARAGRGGYGIAATTQDDGPRVRVRGEALRDGDLLRDGRKQMRRGSAARFYRR